MSKMTLLEMVQDILSDMSSDEVNSIGDTTESLQVANIVRSKYRDIISRIHIPEHEQLFQLVPSNDALKPTLMYIPTEVNRVDSIKYLDTSTTDQGYTYITILPIDQFLDMNNTMDTSLATVGTFTFTNDTNSYPSSYTFSFDTDRQPTYCTIIGNYYVLFDAYNSTVETTLQASKTQCFGQVTPTFLMQDSYIPQLDDKEFSLLLNEAKAWAFYTLKQTPHAKAEQEAKRQWSSVSRNKSVDNVPTSFDQLPDFGKRGTYNVRNRWWNGRK